MPNSSLEGRGTLHVVIVCLNRIGKVYTMTRKRLLLAAGILIFTAVFVWLIVFIVGGFAEWANNNGGFVSAIGLFLIIPFAVWSSFFLDVRRRRKQESAIIALLYQRALSATP